MEDIVGAINSLSNLGPALGSVVVIGILCWKLLQMFDKHSTVLGEIQHSIQAQSEAMKNMSENVSANTKATESVEKTNEKICDLIEAAKYFSNFKK